MDALTKNAPFRATIESIRLYLHASVFPAVECGNARV